MELKVARVKKNLTQKELAARAKVSTRRIVEIEKGNLANVTFSQMHRLANALDCTIQELFFTEE